VASLEAFVAMRPSQLLSLAKSANVPIRAQSEKVEIIEALLCECPPENLALMAAEKRLRRGLTKEECVKGLVMTLRPDYQGSSPPPMPCFVEAPFIVEAVSDRALSVRWRPVDLHPPQSDVVYRLMYKQLQAVNKAHDVTLDWTTCRDKLVVSDRDPPRELQMTADGLVPGASYFFMVLADTVYGKVESPRSKRAKTLLVFVPTDEFQEVLNTVFGQKQSVPAGCYSKMELDTGRVYAKRC